MKLNEIYESAELLQAVKIIHHHAVAAVQYEDLQQAVNFLSKQNPSLIYKGPMFRVVTFDDISPDDWQKLLSDSAGKLVSFSRSNKNWKSILNNLYDAGIANAPEGIFIKQIGTGLDINAVLHTYGHMIASELDTAGSHDDEFEVLAPQQNAKLVRFFADNGNKVYRPTKENDFKRAIYSWYESKMKKPEGWKESDTL